MTITTRTETLHGRRVIFRQYEPAVPKAEPLVLLHGIAGSGDTWLPLLSALDERGFDRTVYVPDLAGHGGSEPPAGDYSIGGYACAVRDLLALLRPEHGHDRITIGGHSLGGGIAMQFAYQFPDLTGRLVLVDSGGLGTEVAPLIRAAALPGAVPFLAVALNKATLPVARAVLGLYPKWSTETRELGRHAASLADPDRRLAFVHTVRTSIGLRGQRTSALDRLYLAEAVPTLIVWGADDRVIPVEHGRRSAELMPGSRLEIVEGAGHFPHAVRPGVVADLLVGFLANTTPATIDQDDVIDLLRARSAQPNR
jgi:pimeloyl-ACP methyl ester carboxylesterase